MFKIPPDSERGSNFKDDHILSYSDLRLDEFKWGVTKATNAYWRLCNRMTIGLMVVTTLGGVPETVMTFYFPSLTRVSLTYEAFLYRATHFVVDKWEGRHESPDDSEDLHISGRPCTGLGPACEKRATCLSSHCMSRSSEWATCCAPSLRLVLLETE